jgi:hypothetical protein
MSKRLVIPRAELAERTDDDMDHAIDVTKSASWSVRVVRTCVVVGSNGDNGKGSVASRLGAGNAGVAGIELRYIAELAVTLLEETLY